MNQDQVKKKLLEIEDASLEFSVIFSGKKSKRVNGLYKSDTREIIIHNRNFTEGGGEARDAVPGADARPFNAGESGENLLMYTAIHEYAHHIHACAKGGRISGKAHTAEFWAILHGLLEKAEKKGVYKDVFRGSKELEDLTQTIRERYLTENGNLVKELGQLLLKAHDLCSAIGGRYEDYVDRVLRIPRQAANVAVRMYQYNLDPVTGPDNMRFLAGIPGEEKRAAAQNALIAGKSPDTVRIAARRKDEDDDPRARLEKEKNRLERTIASLTKRLEEIDRELGA